MLILRYYISQLAILPQVNLNRTRPIFIIQGFLLILQGLKFQFLYSPLQSLKSPFQSQHWYAMKISESRQLSLKDIFLTWPGFELKTAWKKTSHHALTNWAIGTDKKRDKFWDLWMRKRERKSERGWGVCSNWPVYWFWAHSLPSFFLSLSYTHETLIQSKKVLQKKITSFRIWTHNLWIKLQCLNHLSYWSRHQNLHFYIALCIRVG